MTTDALEQRIRVLPESIINQIAAGEVVLRPASVLKELGENAIDAEASTISLWTEQGGKILIQVSDDGIGMSPIDAELCFERHATSKIQSAQDLYRILTKGFRGEALASIAAVAEVELFTRRPQDALGTHVLMAFGQKRLTEPVRCTPGTTVIVRRLFHRLPVRRKSLRSDLTEHRHNLQEFLRLAYPHPERHFRFYHNQTLLYDLSPAPLLERILTLHPDLPPKALLPLEEESPLFRVYGALVPPEYTPSTNREGFLFVNRRYIRHPGLQQAIYQLYKPFLPAETRPLYWLFLDIPPDQADINVTPSKTEVRLLHELEIRAMLSSIVRRTLARSTWTLPTEWLQPSPATLPSAPSAPPPAAAPPPPRPLPLNPTPPLASEKPATRLSFLVMHDRYLLLHLPPEAWLIDLVGAHERILYEKHRQGTPASPQGLLFPVSAPATPLQLARLAELLPELNAQGIHIELREGREAVLHAIPAGLPPSAGTPLLDFLLEIAQTEALPPDWREGLARHIARHGVPRPPYTLTPEAVETLWNALCACEEPNYTPAGHRIRFYLSPEALEKLFT
ncbi:MAG: DNA mismatch repair endonuclease MutL [Bacteroidia bacterium]|jgi:DNA mismatch repair protein MutL|nr:DNA mismatch repair endonuclease MutL [Bacteroidia bacterium]GIV23505.1 MAG: hypothetical protein KatS3mg025_1164 [Bacteroidia bacterium]